jgi:MoaA/NifB/PqqE/SkfB family radical SAM enzyme
MDIIFTPDLSEEKIRRYYNLEDFENAGNLQGKCLTPYLEAMILPDGSLFNCMVNLVGNLKEKSLKELWNNEAAKKWRIYLDKNGYPPICKNCRFRYM